MHPKFSELCIAARDRNLDVELVVSDEPRLVNGKQGIEYRDVVAVQVTLRANPKGTPRATEKATLDTLDKAAQALLWTVS